MFSFFFLITVMKFITKASKDDRIHLTHFFPIGFSPSLWEGMAEWLLLWQCWEPMAPGLSFGSEPGNRGGKKYEQV